MRMNDWAVKKAKLLASPPLYAPADSRPRFLEASSTGPGAGRRSVFIAYNGRRLIKEVSREPMAGSYSLKRNREGYRIISPDGEIFLDNVQVERSIIHAPRQAFLNIEQRCIFNCRFCASSTIRNRTPILSDEKVMAMLEGAVQKGAEGVALTSGVWPDTSSAVERVAHLLSEFHERHSEMTLGAEIYTENPEDLLKLKGAGITELKLNVEVATAELCKKICPEKNFEAVHGVLHDAVSIFGRGKVTSNIIYGLGESDEEVIDEAERVADMGVIPNLRALRITHASERMLRGTQIKPEPVNSARMLRLAAELKSVLEKRQLTLTRFRTMCHACGACDIQPFIDF